jgi:hypothetical protein
MKRHSAFISVVICAGLVATAELGAAAAPDQSVGITFLHLRTTADGFELVEAKTVNGSLRARRYDSAKPGLHVELRSADDRVLFRDVYPEPTVTRLEYEDPQHPGKIRVKEIAPTAEFTIRVPYIAEARTAHFYRRLQASIAGAGRMPILIRQGQVTLPPK